ncbi:DUF6048 family protein [Aestuariibaculum marinum]|uniref:Outer membrane protein beta-barrel domain-containing protein n=1 Tax=Aestuariibaculum marinum TaxID=2683592 RepID=A0A8J6PTR9_9FLAO|nr:DUF6048 family protein [Aestuariibaculum marinum]MBD0822901.1 hypothetical protein [Aestuariibaculum marinum]
MKQQRISIYIISSIACLLLFCYSVNAQNDSIPSVANDSVKVKLKYGLRVGGDLGKLIRSTIDDEYSGFEISADYRIKQKLYIAGELGYEEKNTVNDYLDVSTKGGYIKGGIDYNMYQNWLDMDNMIYFGFRIGGSSFSHDLNNYTVYNTTQYWNQFSSTEARTYDGLTAFWSEIILGIKVEVLTNLYLGLNAQLKFLVAESDPGNFENIYIPGFHKTYDSSGIGVGYGYTVSYRIPLYKKEK